MDDKRTLLGFLLIGLIFLLSPYYYEWMGLSPKPEGPSEGDSVPALEQGIEQIAEETSPRQRLEQPFEVLSEGEKPADSGRPQDKEALISTPTAADPVFSPKMIAVETPLVNLTLSTRGGTIQSALLQLFTLPDGRPVQLIAPQRSGLTVRLQQIDTVEDLSRVEFEPSREKLVVSDGQGTLTMRAQLEGGRIIEKVFTFYSDRYAFDLELRYAGFSEDVDAILGWQGGIPFTESNPDSDLPEMGAIASFNDERVEIKVDNGERDSWADEGDLNWVGARSKYFLSAIIPTQQQARYRAELRGDRTGSSPIPNYSYEIGRQLSSSGSWNSTIYLGPLNYDNLVRYEVGLEQAIDFGWPVIRSVSKFLLIAFKSTHSYIPNYGWIIVLFAVVIKIIVYPLTHKTYESAGKMQELQPKIAALREKYKNDSQRLSQETMKLYKEEGVNPISGCLPMFLQMPIFFALYNVFSKTIELRQAPFALWITDLSIPDEVLVGGFSLHILPLLMAVSMLIQQKMTMKDPKQAFLVYFMPVLMIFFFWSMSSGLVLYWTLFNVLTIGQQVLVNHLKK